MWSVVNTKALHWGREDLPGLGYRDFIWFFKLVLCAMCFDHVHRPSHFTLVPVSSSIKPSLYWLHILGYVAFHCILLDTWPSTGAWWMYLGLSSLKTYLFLSQQLPAANSCSSKVEPGALLSFLMGLVWLGLAWALCMLSQPPSSPMCSCPSVSGWHGFLAVILTWLLNSLCSIFHNDSWALEGGGVTEVPH